MPLPRVARKRRVPTLLIILALSVLSWAVLVGIALAIWAIL